jgi:hypothetical protein
MLSRFVSWLVVVVAALAVVLAGCRAAPTALTCDVPEAVALQAAGRPDGIYGVFGDQVGATPLQRLEHLTLSAQGIDDASGKRWLKLHASGDDARALVDFTKEPRGRSIVLVFGGEVASHHKIRVPIESVDFQVSCCNPDACDRWLKVLRR